ncbi:DUF3472 domain-containing protein [Gelidibacter salicanalis]|uniref:DUF3472 domain-containing protein n=1 Tax=Gelidibacter salicanalis TaxID=291193 RepID=A0A934NIH7_9FLAO|nr:DUF3472 domain-containing protein [Gelidibacter salicanalis]MBJ7882136.1 DUF3472 domain-containing protein [Gelidibacter salicanalis]
MKLHYWVIFCVLVFSCKPQQVTNETSSKEQLILTTEIPAQPNSWMVNSQHKNKKTPSIETKQWTDMNQVMRTYFKTDTSGKLHLGLNVRVPEGISKLKVTLGGTTKTIEISNTDAKTIEVGIFEISEGYNFVEIEGLEKSGAVVANISKVLIGGPATKGHVYFIKDDFYFGRRGPSVHLSYEMPKDKEVVYFYNEINVPKGEDVIGSYYMANGFKDGYFGIQVNSETERRILFSVWSPFDTQDPNEIPDDHKIILLGKGAGVTTGEFGNEGSGGQSYKVYNWKSDTTYKFLLKGVPVENNSTDYTAYFYTPEDGRWNLIASFRRPQASRYLKNLYSFLENFDTKTGNITRKANYNNQWIYSTDKEWTELTTAKFTADATARKESRMDYAGGVEGNQFFMKNCGFFNDTTPIDTVFTRTANGVAPIIDFSKLEIPKS